MAIIDCRGSLGNVFCIIGSALDLAKMLNNDIDQDELFNKWTDSSSYEEVKNKIVDYFKEEYSINIEYITD
jgi:hypothetical protein